jgi:hypothetical protein
MPSMVVANFTSNPSLFKTEGAGGSDRLKGKTPPFDRSAFYSPPCVRQYSLSGVSLSRLRISSQKTSFNEAMHNANANTIITPNAIHAFA